MSTFSIVLINHAIACKDQNKNPQFNYYKWIREAHKMRPDLTLVQFYSLINLAGSTERSCFTQIPLN